MISLVDGQTAGGCVRRPNYGKSSDKIYICTVFLLYEIYDESTNKKHVSHEYLFFQSQCKKKLLFIFLTDK